MAGVQAIVEAPGLDAAAARLNQLAGAGWHFELLDGIGAIAESGVRRRIQEDKAGPDGTPWAAWSEGYAATRHGNQSLLVGGGGLLDSIAFEVDGSGREVAVGSNLVYAAVHQHGGGELPAGNPASAIPARPYLGLSAEDEADIVDLIEGYLSELVQ